ncbi:MAG: potassium-transporting ATPase subunit KdpC [Gammaproteobacteria bacterium]|nr:potassium-transporting ATPase subunit KdpC [Gammaproteobacteria bacterium]
MKLFAQACRLFILLSILTGVLYPLGMTGLAQMLFPWRANGSMLVSDGHVIGSQWIGQNFTADDYFWGRPSSTPGFPYNALASGGSNLGPTNSQYLLLIQNRVREFQPPIPAELVTASGSGLDPDISPQSAYYQANRVADARKVPLETVKQLIQTHTHARFLGLFGEPRVNVLALNLALDKILVTQL